MQGLNYSCHVDSFHPAILVFLKLKLCLLCGLRHPKIEAGIDGRETGLGWDASDTVYLQQGFLAWQVSSGWARSTGEPGTQLCVR